jgi:uncharacterized protein (DUF1778 family)/GNAT superfamily N-acetyltransferase
MRERQRRDVTINQRQRALIDRAAETPGKNRSDFMLEVACREADAVLLDRRFFLLDEKAYKRFAAALDRPPANNPRLRRLLASKGVLGAMTGRAGEISAPEHLTAEHDVAAFDSGVPVLDDWLKRRALANEEAGASRTYVVCAAGRVVGCYALATGGVAQAAATGRVRRNMPDPVPVMVLSRLAADRTYQDRRLGGGLLRDAILRTPQAAAVGGSRAILVQAISEAARRVYQRHRFVESPIDPMALMITVVDVCLGDERGRAPVSVVARPYPRREAHSAR